MSHRLPETGLEQGVVQGRAIAHAERADVGFVEQVPRLGKHLPAFALDPRAQADEVVRIDAVAVGEVGMTRADQVERTLPQTPRLVGLRALDMEQRKSGHGPHVNSWSGDVGQRRHPRVLARAAGAQVQAVPPRHVSQTAVERAQVIDTFIATDFPSGSSFFLSLPSMNGLHGLAFTGPGVFHTLLCPVVVMVAVMLATRHRRVRRRAWLAGAIVVRIAVDQDGFAYWNLSGPNSKTAADAHAFLAQIGGKWTIHIITALGHGPMRFSELLRGIEGVSQKMLTTTLRDLEKDGFVTRTVTPSIPPRVDYALTPLGRAPLYGVASASRGGRIGKPLERRRRAGR